MANNRSRKLEWFRGRGRWSHADSWRSEDAFSPSAAGDSFHPAASRRLMTIFIIIR